MKTQSNVKKLIACAMMIAIATVLALICQFIPFLNLPFGGGFTIASMLPIVLASYLYGLKWGFGTAFCYSLVQMMTGYQTVRAFFLPDQDGYMGSIGAALCICLIDYVLAYTALGCGGVFRRMKNKTAGLLAGVVLALSLRYLAHIISGYLYFGQWAEWFFSQDGMYAIGSWCLDVFSGKMLALVYSVFYNGLYMIPEIILTAIVAIPVSRILHTEKE